MEFIPSKVFTGTSFDVIIAVLDAKQSSVIWLAESLLRESDFSPGELGSIASIARF